MENIENRRLSYYRTVFETRQTPMTVNKLVDTILNSNKLWEMGNYYAVLKKSEPQKAKHYKAKRMSAYCPAGLYLRARNQRQMLESSGLVWVDFDDVENAPIIRDKIGAISNCAICYVSVSGLGVHSLFVTSIKATTAQLYGQVWDYVVRNYIPKELTQYIDPASRKLGQLAIPAYDADVDYKLMLEIPQITLPKPKLPPKIEFTDYLKQSAGHHAQRQLKIYEFLDRTYPPSDYPTWIQLLSSLKHGKIPTEAVKIWSARGASYNEGSFDRAWKSLAPEGGITIGTFIWWAKSQR